MIEVDKIKCIASQCLNCKTPICRENCPLKTNIPLILNYLKNDELDNALALLFQNNNFPVICGTLCNVEKKCNGSCILKKKDMAVDYYKIEEALGAMYYKRVLYKPETINDVKVAIIGGGIAALSAALNFINHGIKPVIFEKTNQLGGVLISSLPKFRFKYWKIIDEYIKFIIENSEVYYDMEFGKNLIFENLSVYDEIILSYGATIPRTVLPSEYVYQAISLLENKQQRDKIKGKKIIILGGGNVAIDIARSLKRNNNDVTIVYRRNIESAPASLSEILHANEEGIKFKECLSPVEVLHNKNDVIGLRCEKMELYNDGTTRLNFRKTNIYEELEADVVVEALGSNVDYEYLKSYYPYIFNSNGYVDVNQVFETTKNGLYLIGDVLTGPNDFASAIYGGITSSNNIIKKHLCHFATPEELLYNQTVAFGGSFNPPTIAHKAIITQILNFNPKELIIIPNGDKYKVSFDNKKLVSFQQRYQMCKLLVNDLSKDKISVIDIENESVFKGTYDTLQKLNNPTFVMGSDCLTNLSKWINYKQLVKENRFVVFTRQENENEVKNIIINDCFLNEYCNHFAIFKIDYPNVSSSKFRLEKKQNYLSQNIWQYIINNELYEVKK